MGEGERCGLHCQPWNQERRSCLVGGHSPPQKPVVPSSHALRPATRIRILEAAKGVRRPLFKSTYHRNQKLNTSSKAKPNQRYCINHFVSLILCFPYHFPSEILANSKNLPEYQDNLFCSPKSISIKLSFLTKCSLVFLRQRPHPLISKFSHSCAS